MDIYTWFIIVGIIFMILISSSIIYYIVYIIKQNELKKTHQLELSNRPTLTIKQRVELDNSLFEFIDELIELEIVHKRKFEIFLHQKNKNLDIDNVLEDVSLSVFNAIRQDVFTDSNNIVTEKYLMSYIQKKTFISYLMYIENNVASQL